MHARIAVLVASSLIALAGTAQAAPRGRHVKVTLVAETDSIRPGQTLVAGLRLQMDAGWHTYWRNPGDAGLPTKAKWSLPEGFVAGELQWPRPIRFNTGPLVSYGYEHEVLLPVEIQVPATLSSNEVRLSARVSWLECEEVCLPGKAKLALDLPVRANLGPGPAAALFKKTRAQLPEENSAWSVSAASGEGSIALTMQPPQGTTLQEAYFYPLTRRAIDYSKPQALQPFGQGYRLELSRHPRGKTVEHLEGVLVGRTEQGTVALEVDVPITSKTAGDRGIVKGLDSPGSR